MQPWMESWGIPEERELPPESVAMIRERLLQTIATGGAGGDDTGAGPRGRRNRPVIAVVVGAAVLVGGGAAAAGIQAVHHSRNQATMVEVSQLDIIYDGQRISEDNLTVLQASGKGLYLATDVDTATDLHATRAFDTEHELDAYSALYAAWLAAKSAGEPVEPWGQVVPQTWTAQ